MEKNAKKNNKFKNLFFQSHKKIRLNQFVLKEIKHELFYKIIKYINGDIHINKKLLKLENYKVLLKFK